MKNQKTLTNKGFSLVELIIVVAIMAILIGVLAPQYLRYVEKTRLQKDNSAISEVANVIKMASADEGIIGELNTSSATVTFSSTGMTVSGSLLSAEVYKTIASDSVKITSSTYGSSAPQLTVEVDSATSIVTVTATGWFDAPGTAHTGNMTF